MSGPLAGNEATDDRGGKGSRTNTDGKGMNQVQARHVETDEEISAETACSRGITTLMFRNVPRKYTPTTLAREVETLVPPESFDFVYLPLDMQDSGNMGYAFVNFLQPTSAAYVWSRMQGRQWQVISSRKKVKIYAAHLQGFQRNMNHCAHKIPPDAPLAHRPLVRHQGQLIDFCVAGKMHARKRSQRKAADRGLGLGRTERAPSSSAACLESSSLFEGSLETPQSWQPAYSHGSQASSGPSWQPVFGPVFQQQSGQQSQRFPQPPFQTPAQGNSTYAAPPRAAAMSQPLLVPPVAVDSMNRTDLTCTPLFGRSPQAASDSIFEDEPAPMAQVQQWPRQQGQKQQMPSMMIPEHMPQELPRQSQFFTKECSSGPRLEPPPRVSHRHMEPKATEVPLSCWQRGELSSEELRASSDRQTTASFQGSTRGVSSWQHHAESLASTSTRQTDFTAHRSQPGGQIAFHQRNSQTMGTSRMTMPRSDPGCRPRATSDFGDSASSAGMLQTAFELSRFGASQSRPPIPSGGDLFEDYSEDDCPAFSRPPDMPPSQAVVQTDAYQKSWTRLTGQIKRLMDAGSHASK